MPVLLTPGGHRYIGPIKVISQRVGSKIAHRPSASPYSAMGVLYSVLFRLPASEYIPFLALGLIICGFISSILAEGCHTFIEAESVLKQIALPASIFVYRVVWRAFLILAHSIPIYLLLLALFEIPLSWTVLLAFPAALLLVGHALWIFLLFGMISARFRDFPKIVGSVVQIAFFLTPIVWKPELLREKMFVVTINPLYHTIEILRGPLLAPRGAFLDRRGSTLLAGWMVAFFAFSLLRPRSSARSSEQERSRHFSI